VAETIAMEAHGSDAAEKTSVLDESALESLSRDGPVVDKTGLKDSYTFSLDWITKQQRDGGEDGPSMYDAVEKLGPHVERQKGSVDVLVVDSVEKTPTDN